jgi:glyoxylase-like metal-dependent hydrolase (beta-lactamase superfamily II)
VYGLDDGQKVSGAGMTFTAIHTPGHTKGSVCVLMEVEGEGAVLFSGDHLFAGSIGRTDLPGGSYEELMASMAEKILPMSDDVQVLPGHGPVTNVGHERRTNPFLLELQADAGAAPSGLWTPN